MPELPEVETIRRGLSRKLVGQRIVSVEVRERRLRRPIDPKALEEGLSGRRIEALSRRAKYLILHLEGGKLLLMHLGMSGRILLRPAFSPFEPHVHVVFGLQNGLELWFQDARRFGLLDVLNASHLAEDQRFSGLGVEPLSRACTGRYFYDRSRGLRKPVKNFLMDARQVAGVGNIYANEALFLAGIRPPRPAGSLSLRSWEKLAASLRQVLRDAIRQGGTTLRDFRDADGESGYFQVFLRVYDRAGEACRSCGRIVRRVVLAGRSSFYCPRCQR
jgi:formamidopyrimidine-DNA glycosylase